MATHINVANEDLADVQKSLEAAGEVVEIEIVDTAEPKPEASAEAGDGEPVTKAEPVKEPAKDKKDKQEETPKSDAKGEDWNSLPDWARRQIEKLREDKRSLRDRLEDERVRPTAASEPAKPAADVEITFSGKPEPRFEDFEKADDPYREYTKAHSRWAREEAVAQVRAETAARERANAERRTQVEFDERQKEAVTLIPDYDEVLEEAVDIKASPVMQHVIYRSAVGPHLLYHLAQNPDECRRIYQLPEDRALIAMGRLEQQVESAVDAIRAAKPTSKKESPKPKPTSSAPEPVRPLGGSHPPAKSIRELAGPEDRIIDDVLRPNPDFLRRRNEERRR